MLNPVFQYVENALGCFGIASPADMHVLPWANAIEDENSRTKKSDDRFNDSPFGPLFPSCYRCTKILPSRWLTKVQMHADTGNAELMENADALRVSSESIPQKKSQPA
jgi:hypothetical protein